MLKCANVVGITSIEKYVLKAERQWKKKQQDSSYWKVRENRRRKERIIGEKREGCKRRVIVVF